MPITTIDDRSALIVIDLQKGIIGLLGADASREIVARSARLAEAFRARGLPVVLVNVSGMPPGRTSTPRPTLSFPPDWAELVPELNRQKSDHTVTKQRWGAFLGTDLDAYLRGQGVTEVVLTGIATSAGVESTARSASDLGYHVALVVDAMTDRSAEAHRHSVETIFPRLGETGTTDEVLDLLTS